MRKVRKINGFTSSPIYIVAAKLNKTPKIALAGCQNAQPKCKLVRGFSLVELMMAFAIIVIIFAAIVPQFRAIRNSWTGNEAKAGIIQNGRVLVEHIVRNLSAAKKITTVTPSSTLNGYIVFVGSDGNSYRYQSLASYVRFGTVIPLRWITGLLAGPVNRFQIRCYSLSDLNNPTTDVNIIRLVQIEADFTNTQGPKNTFTASAYLQTNANTGLVGHWKLDETSGFTAADSSGFGRNGTLTNINEWATGLIGGALAFDGTDDYVTIPDGAYLHIENLSISFWVKTSQTGSSGEWYKNPLILEKDTPGLGNDGFGTGLNNQKLEFVIGDSVLTSNGSVSDGVWHHIALTKDSSKNTAIYIDGSFDKSGVATYNFTNTVALHIGKPLQGAYFNGVIDDVRIYDCVLEPNEIAQLANALRLRDCNEAKASSD
jgi:type II secretory pathway pseudopilin PulG